MPVVYEPTEGGVLNLCEVIMPPGVEFLPVGDRVYQCRAMICPEPEGGYSAFALRLPGVVSQGESIEDAIDNLKEAFAGALEEYLSSGEAIPWKDVIVEGSEGSVERWVAVDV